jgi:hypothetical protein
MHLIEPAYSQPMMAEANDDGSRFHSMKFETTLTCPRIFGPLYTWRRKFAGVDVVEARRIRELERENARLKKMVVDRDPEVEVMKEIAAKMVSVPQEQQERPLVS